VFAPTDAAFAALSPGALTTLLKPDNLQLLTDILTYHVVEGTVLSTDLSDGLEVDTLNPDATLIIGVGTTVTVNNVIVSSPDVLADNGVIHIIDQVLIPPGLVLPLSIVEIATKGDFPTLAIALKAAGLVATLAGEGPFTVFAPNEAAFAKVDSEALNFLLRNTGILATVLSYHVVSGAVLSSDLRDGLVPTLLPGASIVVSLEETIRIDDSNVVRPDDVALNGVIHVIDEVLLPLGAPSTFPPDIAGLVVAVNATNGEFATLLAALIAGELVDTLSGPGPFTVFAPSEAAFAKLPAGTIETLLLPQNKALLIRILLQHVVSGDVKAADITGGMTARALNGETLTFAITGARITVNGVRIVTTDILALNGVVHVIDQVLIPDVDAGQQNIIVVSRANGGFLGECQGDCDVDEDCEGGLVCFQRDGGEPVPGCLGGDDDNSRTDYCVLNNHLQQVGNNKHPSSAYPLGECQGDCDADEECDGGLVCFQRDGGDPVPGCLGGEDDNSRTDYCVST
jgi:transforming growth factor-beta-induced protein